MTWAMTQEQPKPPEVQHIYSYIMRCCTIVLKLHHTWWASAQQVRANSKGDESDNHSTAKTNTSASMEQQF